MANMQADQSGLQQAMAMYSLLSASTFGMCTIFGLGIMPYISASIIFQLLAYVYPPLEQLQKEGEAGRKKINEYTRYAAVFICFFQSWFWLYTLTKDGGMMGGTSIMMDEYKNWYFLLTGSLVMTAGTILLMWIGEQIDEYGIGNGISLLILAGILARLPDAFKSLIMPALNEGVRLGTQTGIEKLLLLVCLFVVVVMGVVAMTQAQRKIQIQSAKHQRGQRVGGQRQYLPLRLNQAGVMPIIFASSLLMLPWMVFRWLSSVFPSVSVFQMISDAFQDHGYVYNMCYIALIYFFCYFWTSITFNPKDMADNLKDYGSFIPGYRPGGRTAGYLEEVMERITYVGAGFLALVAVIPTLIANALGVDFLVASFFGGTGLLICVSVALDLIQKIDSHLVMRNYPGLLESEPAS
jgi:preprotein translocase subunit SecY